METAKAMGGPRDGIKLSAPYDWDGKVAAPGTFGDGAIKRFHPGRYVWLASIPAWVWQVDESVRRVPGVRTARSEGHRKPLTG